MILFNKNIIILIVICFFNSSTFLSAQAFGASVQTSWQEGFPMTLAQEERRLSLQSFDPQGNLLHTERALPEGSRYALGWGEVWRIRPGQDKHAVYRSLDGLTWMFEGYLRHPEPPQHFAPLSSERMVVSGWSPPMVLNGEASALGVFRKNETGDFVLERLVQPLSQPWFQRGSANEAAPSASAPARYEVRRAYKLFTFHSLAMSPKAFRPLPRGAAFVSLYTGRVWILDEKGSIKRHYTLCEGFKEEDWSRLLQFEPALLEVVPLSSGTLLAASRTPEAVLEARKRFPIVVYINGAATFPEGDPRISAENQMKAGFHFPQILWWNLDPAEASPKRLDTSPSGAPSELPGTPEHAQLWIQNFEIRVDRHDLVRVLHQRLPEAEPQAALAERP